MSKNSSLHKSIELSTDFTKNHLGKVIADTDDDTDYLDESRLEPPNEGEHNCLCSDKEGEQNLTAVFILTTFAISLGAFQYGYNSAVTNQPHQLIKDFMNKSIHTSYEFYPSPNLLTNLWAFTVSSFSLGGAIGAFSSGPFVAYFGRKGGLYANLVIGFLATSLLIFSPVATSFEMIIAGRLCMGYHCGLYSGICPLFLNEISSSKNRGVMGNFYQLGTVSGILVAQILGFPVILGHASGWVYLFGMALAPLLIQILLLPMCPESPRYLITKRRDVNKARIALYKLKGSVFVEKEISTLIERNKSHEKEMSLYKLLTTKELRKDLVVGVLIAMSPQISGINGVIFYSTQYLKGAGVSGETARYATSGVGITMITMAFVSMATIDRFGQRSLLLFGLAGMGITSMLLAITSSCSGDSESCRFLNIIMLVIFVVFFGSGPGPVPWVIVAELFSPKVKHSAVSFCFLFNWVSNFTVGYIFPQLQSQLEGLTFVPFGCISLLMFGFMYRYLPETKGRLVEDLAASFTKDDSKMLLKELDEEEQEFRDDRMSTSSINKMRGFGINIIETVAL